MQSQSEKSLPGKSPPKQSLQVALKRRATFSSAHHYFLSGLSESENVRLFHACSNRHGHGHDYILWVTVLGPVDPETGMVANLKDLKQILDTEVVACLDHKHLNHQVPPFTETTVPTLENLARFIAGVLQAPLAKVGLQLSQLKLIENETLCVDYELEETRMRLTRRYDFCASHRLYNPAFSDSQNWEVFRECSSLNGHGHNYDLEVTIEGEPNAQTGLLIDIVYLDQVVKERILQHVDHKHLNLDVPFLSGMIPTAENLVIAFWNELEADIPAFCRLATLTLHETRNNVASYSGATGNEGD